MRGVIWFLHRADVVESGCWEWRGWKHDKGYGLLEVSKKKVRAHRVAYEGMVGEIPEGLLVCHKCDNPCCVNPDHLFVGTYRDNVLDMHRKGRFVGNRKKA